MTKILFVAPIQGNGGIASWAANFRKNITHYELISIGLSKRRATNVTAGLISRIFEGFLDMLDVFAVFRKTAKKVPDVKIMHLTACGGMGTIRDYILAHMAKRRGMKTIMHCHFGSVVNDMTNRRLLGKLLLKCMLLFDQIWVLDTKSLSFLSADAKLKGKVFLMPNFIDVRDEKEISSKTYKNVAFVGNLFPEKGLYELVNAVKSLNNGTILHIVGPGLPSIENKIKELAGDKFDKTIIMYGKMSNDKAIQFINKIDILALPTYYHQEAFPISILEAMSCGKMVISCDRGAIKDMLTSQDGTPCGLIVKPKDSDDIKGAIEWCQNFSNDADCMCRKAFEKVKTAYSTDAVIRQYEYCYKMFDV